MFRLKYGTSEIFKGSDLQDFQKNYKNRLSGNLTYTSFETLFNYLETVIKKNEETKILIFPLSDRTLFFKQDKSREISEKTVTFVSEYIFENEHMRELFYKILRLKVDGDGRLLVSTFSNYFSFIMKKEVLNIIFRYNLLLSNGVNPYNKFKIPKKSGGMREIIAPEGSQQGQAQKLPGTTLAEYLSECNHLFQKIFDGVNSEFQVAYKCGKNIKDNAKIHKNKKFVFVMDMKDFYPSCKRNLVSDAIEPLFEKIFNGDVLKELFLDAILYNDALFIGSAIAGCLANKIFSTSASYMRNICKTHDMEYSVYADDITFSSDRYISYKFAEGIFTQGLVKFGLEVYFKQNSKKSHGASSNRRRITGVSINHRNECTVSKYYYRELRAALDHLSKGKFSGNLQKLRGKVAFATMVDDSGKITSLLRKEKTAVQKYNIVSNEKLKELGV